MSQNSEPISAHIQETTLLHPAIQAWKIYLRDQGRSHHTLKAFSADLNLLESYLPTDKQIGQITTADLENHLYWMENERDVPCSPKTLSRRITSIKSFFRWLFESGVLKSNPADPIIQKPVASRLPHALTQSEYRLALEAARAIRDGAKADPRPLVLFQLVLETALKKGECLSLMVEHLEIDDPKNAALHVRYSNPRYRYKERRLPLSQDWVEAYTDYAQQYDIKDQVFPWSQRRLEYLLSDIAEEAKFEKNISFDSLRWTSAVIDLSKGVDPDSIRQKLGISKIQWRDVQERLHKIAEEYDYTLS
ncbi:MAG TPA: site-specific integrase [Anaerolineaceae bacterium]|nr:site-specific integrase [Anaerolineaceae bacterium]